MVDEIEKINILSSVLLTEYMLNYYESEEGIECYNDNSLFYADVINKLSNTFPIDSIKRMVKRRLDASMYLSNKDAEFILDIINDYC